MLPLMEGLQGDLLPADDHAAELLGVELHSFDSAVEHALGEWEEIRAAGGALMSAVCMSLVTASIADRAPARMCGR